MLATCLPHTYLFFFFNDTATTEIYTLSLHDALPIWRGRSARGWHGRARGRRSLPAARFATGPAVPRSEEHTSELQSQSNLVCRLLLEKKKTQEEHDLSTSIIIVSRHKFLKL